MSDVDGEMDGKGALSKKIKGDRPFYETPEHLPTSSKIINEARSSLRSVQTKRPFTPREENRTLFGASSSRNPETRPPSAFSLGSRHFDGSDSRPVSGTRLTPIEHRRIPSDASDILIAPKPPVDPNRQVTRRKSRQQLPQNLSNESLQTEGADSFEISPDGKTNQQERRVQSGPKERLRPLSLEERGEGDGAAASNTDESKPSGRGGSAGARLSQADEALYNEKLAPMLEEMSSLKGVKGQSVRLQELTVDLYGILRDSNLLGRNCKQRSAILKTIFHLLDADEPKLLLSLARLILSLKVSGNNLTNVCKLVFKVSRDQKNDENFLDDNNLLELLVECAQSTDLIASPDALVYCAGALKFLSGNSQILRILTKIGTIPALGYLLASINKLNSTSGKPGEQLGHILVQVTATLRNLADSSSSREQYLSLNVIDELLTVLDNYPQDCDLVLNIARILSKLTQHTECCIAISRHSTAFQTFLYILNKHQKKDDVIVRISFILGNLTAKNDDSRLTLMKQPKCVDILLGVFKNYVEMDMKISKSGKETSSKVEDVMIKLVRVIANLSINENVGPILSTNKSCLDLLLYILETKDVTVSEELVLNTISTINNLTYYLYMDGHDLQMRIAQCLIKLIWIDHTDTMIETARVYGNLTRQRPIRDFLMEKKVGELMITLLDSGSRELVYTACGILINLMADSDKRSVLKCEGGISKLIDVLRDLGRDDWQLASLVCQILWNYSSKITSTNDCFGQEDSTQLNDLLIEYLDEECALTSNVMCSLDRDMQEIVKIGWLDDFCPVASQLLQRLESHQTDLEPLQGPE